jgi:monoamine oxidase
MKRRAFLGSSAAAGTLALLGCEQPHAVEGGFTGINVERGHLFRDRASWPAPSITRRVHTVIAGAGIAGLAAARALRLRGVDDHVVLELEDTAGGNSRGTTVAGMACPMGAHYLPVPGDDAHEVQDLLEELGLRQRVAGRWEYEERHLCHSPQERLYFKGEWQDGLLPVQAVGAGTLRQYQQFADLVEQARSAARWSLPASRTPLTPFQRTLKTQTFDGWLAQHGLDDPQLRWYLDYCCRDDYGAGSATVSAWAGIHYFASRHGFHAPGNDSAAERDGVLTWPEGNAWLARRLAAPLGPRLLTGQMVLRIAQDRHGVQVDTYNTASQAVERWQAQQAIVALPLFIAARVVQNPPDFLLDAAKRTPHAPWLVANIHIDQPLHDKPGAAPSWDNVLYGPADKAPGLGYVDAMHQSLLPVPGATVLSYYRALGDVPGGRKQLLEQPFEAWRDAILAELAQAHPDLPRKARRMDITRYGHAMAVPVPGLPELTQPFMADSRLRFAHSDWAGYSVFEEAFAQGHAAGSAI